MKDKNILVIGYFGSVDNQVDGQTIRTKSIYSLLKERANSKVSYFDTQTLKTSKTNYIKLLKLILNSNIIFNIGAQRNLKIFFPILYTITLITRADLNYIAIGGWLHEYLEDKRLHKFMLKRVKNLFVQTDNLCQNLRVAGFQNVHLLNNFRLVDFPEIKLDDKITNIQKLVFMARVHPLKGVDTIFKIDQEIRRLNLKNISIDIYGPIAQEYKGLFFERLKKSNVKYLGSVEPVKVYHTLTKYDLLLFPTQYYTEGFPGSILDAYISGIPVIATEWLNAHEFIVADQTGYIVEFNNEEAFIDKVISIIKTPIKPKQIKENILNKRNEYSANYAWDVLKLSI